MLRSAVFRASVVALTLVGCSLAGCSEAPLRRDVIAQAQPGGQVAFDVVKIDGPVVQTVLAETPPPFHARFATYVPPPKLQIAVGDVISVVIWETGPSGLFGAARPALSLPPGTESAPVGQPTAPLPAPAAPAAPDDPAAPEGQNLDGSSALDAVLAAASEQNDTSQNLSARSGNADSEAPMTAQSPAPTPALPAIGGGVETQIPDQTVGPDGAITVPYAGRIKVAGRTPEEVQKDLERRLASRALHPQALVIDKRSPANSVSVEGEKIGGKRVQLPLGGARLLQVIAAAGGAHAPPYQTFVRLSRGGVTATVPLATLVADPGEDIYARPGDVLTLVPRRQTFSVFGETGKNAEIPFDSERLSLSEALGKAGGLRDARADPRAVFLFRYEPDPIVQALHQPVAPGAPAGISPIAYRLDLHDAKSLLLARRFPVHNHDVIFVTAAESVPLYEFFGPLSKITGAVVTGLITCQYAKC